MKKLIIAILIILISLPWINALGGKFNLTFSTVDGHEMTFYADRGRFKTEVSYKNKVHEVRGYYAVLFDTIYFIKSSTHILSKKRNFDLHEFLRENKKLFIVKLRYEDKQLVIKKISEDPRKGIIKLKSDLHGKLAFHSIETKS